MMYPQPIEHENKRVLATQQQREVSIILKYGTFFMSERRST